MLFSTSIPDKLQEHPNTLAFSNLMDELQDFKTEIISEALRVDNYAVLMDSKWLLRKLEEFGISDLPLAYPVRIIQQYLLNVDTVCRTRGSKIGLELYCSLLSLGSVTFNDDEFYAASRLLLLDSETQGFITDDTNKKKFYLSSSTVDFDQASFLTITINSVYFNGEHPNEAELIKSYIENTIESRLGFSPGKVVTFNYGPATKFYFHKLLNPYFI